jgi:23S rRNA (pseudouridine1915-N3)-methyltransferase
MLESRLHQARVLCILAAMQINLITIGNRMPGWVQQGYEEYAKRLPRECALILKEIVSDKRGKPNDIARVTKGEGERMLGAIPPGAHIVTLDIGGKSWSTLELSQVMKRWLESGQNIALLIGGPEGLSDSAKQLGRESWSLSNLTFPHPLVRILVAEQLYRAWSLLNNHPYHRE